MARKIPGWEPVEPGEPNASQIVDGQWYFALFGCDSLQTALDELVPGWIPVEEYDGNDNILALSKGCVISHIAWKTSRKWLAYHYRFWMPAPPPPEPLP